MMWPGPSIGLQEGARWRRRARAARAALGALGLGLALLAPVTADAVPQQAEGPARVDFDDRLIRGQRKANGVYIFQRDKVELASMVSRPRSFRQRIIETVFHPPPRRR